MPKNKKITENSASDLVLIPSGTIFEQNYLFAAQGASKRYSGKKV